MYLHSIFSFIIIVILIFSLFNISLEQCVLGANCPVNQGECVNNACNCLSGFYTLLDPKLPPEQQTYCNYEQINVYAPVILELFMPSFGHFYTGKYYLGIAKLILLFTYLTSSYYLYDKIKMPIYIRYIMEKFGPALLSLIGLKIAEDEEEEEKKEEDVTIASIIKQKFKSGKTVTTSNIEEGLNRGETSQMIQAHDKLEGDDKLEDKEKEEIKYNIVEQIYDEDNKPTKNNKDDDDNKSDKEKPLLDKDDKDQDDSETGSKDSRSKDDTKVENIPIKNIFELSSLIFSIMYFADLFFFKFKIYTDGYGIPFIE